MKFLIALARLFFRVLFAPPVWFLYRMRRIGLSNVPKTGGVLLLSNHVSYIDSFILFYASPRHVRFVVREEYMHVKGVSWFLRLFGAIPIQPKHPRQAITNTVEALKEGDVVCLFPEGTLTRLGVTTDFKKGFELIARQADCPVVPVYMDGLFQSIFSFERGRFFRKKPRAIPCRLQIAFGPPIPPREASIPRVQMALWEQSAAAFSARYEFRAPLEVATIRALKRRRGKVLFIEDARSGTRIWTRAKVLAAAIAVARRWMADPGERGTRIGILLPPGPISSTIQIGLVLAGRVPVTLPFTLDPRDTESIARRITPLQIRTVITSRAFMPHLADFWVGEEGVFIDMKAVVSPPNSLMTMFERVRALLEPSWMTCWRLDLKKRDPDREAVGLLPDDAESASFLSSRELLRDTVRVYSAHFVDKQDTILCEEPASEAEGLVFGCWGPTLGYGTGVSRSLTQRGEENSLEQAVTEHSVTHIVGGAEFYSLLTTPLPDSLKFGIVFGDVEPSELQDWEQRLGISVVRASSVNGRFTTMSLPDHLLDASARQYHQSGGAPESIGHLLPGIAVREEDDVFSYRFGTEKSDDWIASGPVMRIANDGLLFPKDAQ